MTGRARARRHRAWCASRCPTRAAGAPHARAACQLARAAARPAARAPQLRHLRPARGADGAFHRWCRSRCATAGSPPPATGGSTSGARGLGRADAAVPAPRRPAGAGRKRLGVPGRHRDCGWRASPCSRSGLDTRWLRCAVGCSSFFAGFNVLEAKLPALVSQSATPRGTGCRDRRLFQRTVPRHVRRRRRRRRARAARRHRGPCSLLLPGRSLAGVARMAAARPMAPPATRNVTNSIDRRNVHGIGQQGDPARQPRARPRNALHARRRRGHQHHHRHHRAVEGQERREAGKDRMASRRLLRQARPRSPANTSRRAARSTSRAACRRASGRTRTASTSTPPRSSAIACS